ncbi:MAG: sigma-24 (FecI-like) [Myxococcaceae bacterium]|nr:sigma-24 (FecI-like) [Myxococcaceae bacterium]
MRVLRIGFHLNSAEAEDVMQESFIRAFRHLDQLREPARFGLWVQVIARREALASVQGRAHRQQVDLAAAAEAAKLVEQAPPEDPALQVVRGLLAQLEDGPERRIVHRFYVDGDCTVQQLADELGLAKGTITSRLTRFRARIKRRLVALMSAAQADPTRGDA